MKKIILILVSCFLILNSSSAQPVIEWQKCLGGTNQEYVYSIEQTADGGYILAGYTGSNNGDVTGNHSNYDYWVVKLDSSGNLQWQKCLGGTNDDEAYSIEQTTDGGYIVAGRTESYNGDVTGNHGNMDYWIVKLDGSGNIQWQKCLGGTYNDAALSVQQTSDGGYIVAGSTISNDGDVTGNHGIGSYSDYWVVKLDGSGNIQWQKCLGGTSYDDAYSVQQTVDGGYIVAGSVVTNDGDITGNHGGSDYWLVKLNSGGNIQWQKCLGGTNADGAYSVQQISDGGYIVGGWTKSSDGDVTGFHAGPFFDYWVVKLNNSGNIQWEKCLGGTNNDGAYSVQQTADGGFIVAGSAQSNDGDVTGNHDTTGTYYDYWVVKLDSSGNIQWQKCLGGTGDDGAYSIQQTADGGLIVAGSAQSIDGDVTGNHDTTGNTYDYWIVKLSPYVGIEEEEINNDNFSISPNPFIAQALISFGNPVYNATFFLYNLLGEKVIETKGITGESYELNRGSLPSGVYVFEISEKGKSVVRGKAVVH